MSPEPALPLESSPVWAFGPRRWTRGPLPRIFGIVNVTPDSFSDGGAYFGQADAVRRGRQLADEGADILDVGGESTRPGSEIVAVDEELRRVVPVIERLAAETSVPISVDTTKAAVARAALAAGASIVNDISGLTFDPEMIPACAASDCGVVVMHIQGTPQTMQIDPRYDNAVEEIDGFLQQQVSLLGRAGIAEERILLDPGIGFGKTPRHNMEILRGLNTFRRRGRPVLIGHSRKRFLSRIVGHPLDERDAATVGVSIAAAQLGADYLRVHDVRQTRDALLAWSAVLGGPAGDM